MKNARPGMTNLNLVFRLSQGNLAMNAGDSFTTQDQQTHDERFYQFNKLKAARISSAIILRLLFSI